MALATTVKFGKQQLLIGNGASPEVFTAPCGITSLTKTTNVESASPAIPDCTDPDAVSWLGYDEISRQIRLSFSGLIATEYLPKWKTWDLGGGAKTVRWNTDLTAINGGGYLQGPAYLSAFEETADAKGRYTMSGTITFDGKPTFTAAP